ncbi:MAG: ABC transporter substrate-binding protein [Acetobacteraceae bacterium]
MKRRTFLAAAAAASLARPAIAAGARTLVFVPQANLTSLDPVWTTATVTRNYALMVFETLYGRDEAFRVQPLMVEGHVIEDEGRRWTMRLRDGLLWHDGTPVLARDCLASLQRWMKRDAAAPIIQARVDAIEATDDRTLVWRLKRPFPLLAHFLSKVQPSPVMMPERIAANTDPFKQVAEIIGCGPFRFVKDEYVSGSFAAFAKFDKYTPRPEPGSYTAGGHQVHVDRVEWRVIPDPATAANALASGEVDWLELPQPDLMPMLKAASGVTTGLLDIYGTIALLRPNHLQGPTANPALRRAMLAAIDQKECMIAAMGEDPATWRVPVGFFVPGMPSAAEAGMENVRNRKSLDEVRKMVEASGYKGERLVVLHPTDQVVYNAVITVAVDALRKAGLNIDEQMTDWGTIVQRRTSKEPLDKGGWSLFPAGAPAPEFVDPLLSNPMRSNGPRAWFGWPDDPRIENAYAAWIDATTDAERRKLEADYQLAAFDSVPIIPCGQYLPHAAWRKNVSGQLKGSAPVFWGVRKA